MRFRAGYILGGAAFLFLPIAIFAHKGLAPLFVICCLAFLLVWKPASADDTATGASDARIVPPNAELEELWNEGEFTEGVAVAPDGTLYFSDISRDETPGWIVRREWRDST